MMGNVIVCPKCGMYDQMTASYACANCDQQFNQGPSPTGLPYSQPCPGGCGATLQATNKKCLRPPCQGEV